MERNEFNLRASQIFSACVDTFDEIDPDVVEAEFNGDILKILFPDGVQFILNTQSAAHQIWLAGQSRGWHFDYDPARDGWYCKKSGDELVATLSEMVAQKLGPNYPFTITVAG